MSFTGALGWVVVAIVALCAALWAGAKLAGYLDRTNSVGDDEPDPGIWTWTTVSTGHDPATCRGCGATLVWCDECDPRDDGEPAIPDPVPPQWQWVPYGTAGAYVHRGCAADRQGACTYCARVMGTTRSVTP